MADGRSLEFSSDPKKLRETIASIDAEDARGLDRFLEKCDRFAERLGSSYCDRMLSSWPDVLLSKLLWSAFIVPPQRKYTEEIDSHFRHPAIRELFYGLPTFSGYDPATAPASLVILPWTILREGVWYPAEGGIAAIPRAIARAAVDKGVKIVTGAEVNSIVRNASGQVTCVESTAGSFPADVVVSNADYIRTHQMLSGGPDFSESVQKRRRGEISAAASYFTLQLGCNRQWDDLAHHMILLTKGSNNVYNEIFVDKRYPADPAIYLNVTSETDPADAPSGGCNPFIVVGIPPFEPGQVRDVGRDHAYAETIIQQIETQWLPGFKNSITDMKITSAHDWYDRFYAHRGAIYGLGTDENILDGAFRPINTLQEVPNLYFVGTSVQPGPGMPMVAQSGKIVADLVAKNHPNPGFYSGYRPKWAARR
jgi:diapolycopene oxygenase